MNKKTLWVCFVLAVFLHSAASAAPKKPVNEQSSIRPFSVPPELDADMARYSLRAYENTDAANPVKVSFSTPGGSKIHSFEPYVLIQGAGLAAGDLEKFALADNQPAWVDRLAVVGGDLVLVAKRPGLMMSVR